MVQVEEELRIVGGDGTGTDSSYGRNGEFGKGGNGSINSNSIRGGGGSGYYGGRRRSTIRRRTEVLRLYQDIADAML